MKYCFDEAHKILTTSPFFTSSQRLKTPTSSGLNFYPVLLLFHVFKSYRHEFLAIKHSNCKLKGFELWLSRFFLETSSRYQEFQLHRSLHLHLIQAPKTASSKLPSNRIAPNFASISAPPFWIHQSLNTKPTTSVLASSTPFASPTIFSESSKPVIHRKSSEPHSFSLPIPAPKPILQYQHRRP